MKKMRFKARPLAVFLLAAFLLVTVPLAMISANPTNLRMYDNFAFDKAYSLTDGQTSPGLWIAQYNGYGYTGVQNVGGTNMFVLQPKTSTSSSETHASLVTTTNSFADISVNFDVRTVKQLRQNNAPKAWETAWIFFRYTSENNFYYFTWKPTGIELGKKQGSSTQIYLVTEATPQLILNTWSNWQINAIGNHIQILLNGAKVIDYVDKTMSSQLSSGAIGLYCEDALVNFANLSIA